jgi:hypothetical protein
LPFKCNLHRYIEALCKTADRREGHDTVTPLVEVGGYTS